MKAAVVCIGTKAGQKKPRDGLSKRICNENETMRKSMIVFIRITKFIKGVMKCSQY
jgi:hypothetical protein